MPGTLAPDHEGLRGFMEMFNLFTGPEGLMIDQEVAEKTALARGISPERIMQWRAEEGLVRSPPVNVPWVDHRRYAARPGYTRLAGTEMEQIANYYLWGLR